MTDQAAKRRALKSSASSVRLDTSHTKGGVLLPDRLALLDAMPKHGVVAEIGVANGDFSAEILARTYPERLHLIDTWSVDRYAPHEATVRDRFAPDIDKGRVIIDKGISTDVLAEFPDDYFDWVYIDTNHTYKTTAAELKLSATALKSGGLILGHDFCNGNIVTPVVYGVIQAVNEFCVASNWRYHYMTLESHGHFSFCIGPMTSSHQPEVD
ncbi:MAG: class I SAM-dependent methyltransferase [Rhodobacteraceae bacterium]|nr:class I SAM-dependent methyltransferase [Paracoccaceae bacterium]